MLNLDSFAQKAPTLGVLGLKVTQNGQEIAHQTWDEECRRNVYSASKSVTSCAVGFALQEGLLSLSERLVDCFPEELPEQVDDNLAQATVRDPVSYTHLDVYKRQLPALQKQALCGRMPCRHPHPRFHRQGGGRGF